jgi:hypothetical protein
MAEKDIDMEAAPRDLVQVEILAMLRRINRKLNELLKERKPNMATESPLDQAIDGLGTAVAGKLAEDQVVNELAAEAVNETAETAKIEQLTETLNQETAAEQQANPPAAATTTASGTVAESIPASASAAVDETPAPVTDASTTTTNQ